MLSKAFWTLKRIVDALQGWLARQRRAWFVRRLRLRALWLRTRLDIDVAPDAVIGRRIRVELVPGNRVKLVMESGARIDDDARLLLRSGELILREGAWLRSHCIINLRGRFELGAQSIISWYTVVHCSESVTIGNISGFAEHCTVADSTHFFTEPDAFFYHNARHAPVTIGDNTWIAANATVAHGTRIGNHCIIGSGVVVSGEVPDGHIIADAKPTARELRLPWKSNHRRPTFVDSH